MLYILEVIINIILSLIEYSVIIECVCSFIPQLAQSSFYAALTSINAPLLKPFRRLLSKAAPSLPVDLSPVLLFAVIEIVRRLL